MTENTEKVRITLGRPVRLNLTQEMADKMGLTTREPFYKAGSHEVPVGVAEHRYIKANIIPERKTAPVKLNKAINTPTRQPLAPSHQPQPGGPVNANPTLPATDTTNPPGQNGPDGQKPAGSQGNAEGDQLTPPGKPEPEGDGETLTDEQQKAAAEAEAQRLAEAEDRKGQPEKGLTDPEKMDNNALRAELDLNKVEYASNTSRVRLIEMVTEGRKPA